MDDERRFPEPPVATPMSRVLLVAGLALSCIVPVVAIWRWWSDDPWLSARVDAVTVAADGETLTVEVGGPDRRCGEATLALQQEGESVRLRAESRDSCGDDAEALGSVYAFTVRLEEPLGGRALDAPGARICRADLGEPC